MQISTKIYNRSILMKIKRLENIKRTVLIAKSWNTTNISKILSKNTA